METLKSILVDSLNGFSPKYIPLFIFQLLMAGFLGLLMQQLLNRKFKTKIISNGTLIAVGIALIAAISKNSLPFAVLAAAAMIILAIQKQREQHAAIALFIISLIGVGCGVGSVVQTLIGSAVIAVIILFLPLKDEQA